MQKISHYILRVHHVKAHYHVVADKFLVNSKEGREHQLIIQKLYHNAALEGLAAVVNHVICSIPVLGSTLYVHTCHPCGVLPAPELAGCPVGRGE